MAVTSPRAQNLQNIFFISAISAVKIKLVPHGDIFFIAATYHSAQSIQHNVFYLCGLCDLRGEN